MLRFANLNLADSLAFVDDPDAARPQDEEMLTAFLSIRRRNITKLAAPEDYGAFAARYGSLLGPVSGVPIPVGAMSLMTDVGALRSEEGATVYVEPRSLWRFHVDAMRDVAMLHAFANHVPCRKKTTGVRLLRDNCIVYENGKGGLSCLYHGTNGLHPDMRWPGRAPGRVPDDVSAYLDAIGAGFAFSAAYHGKSDSAEGREAWLTANAGAVISAYLNSYLACFPGGEGTLLGDLQSLLADLVAQDRPLTFCILCGGVATREVEEYTSNFDGNPCRALTYRIREEVEELLVRDGGYAPSQARMMLDTSRGGYKVKG